MIKIFTVFIVAFFPAMSFAMHHESGGDTGYDHGAKQYRNSHSARFKFNQGEEKKFRPHRPQPYFKMIRGKLRRLDAAKREEAIKEIERHIQAMSTILAGEKGFPEYKMKKRVDNNKASADKKAAPQNNNQSKKDAPKKEPNAKQKKSPAAGTNSSNISNDKRSYQKIKRMQKIV